MGYKNWQLHIDDQIATLVFDLENSGANTLSTPAMKELDAALDEILKKDTLPRALIISSAKKAGFCMGADINEFRESTDLALLKQHVEFGQTVMQKIADLPFPSIALIHGFCLGGGLELALACRYRIGQYDEVEAQLGLPEVRLGLCPAWGGTARLPQVIHPLQALNMMLTGRTVKSKAAKRLGLLDVIVPKRQMVHAARYIALNPLPKRKFQVMQKLCHIALIRRLAAVFVTRQVKKQATPEHYPAPFMMIDAWKSYGGLGKEAYTLEVDQFMALLNTETAKNLIRIFFLQEQLKALGKKVSDRIQHVHVIGAGTMGGDIAAWCAFKGLTVSLQDRTAEALQNAMRRANELMQTQFKKDKRSIEAVMDRLIPDVNGEGVVHADLIIEAIFENLALKQEVLVSVAQRKKPEAIIATNTSSISLDDLKTALPDPNQLVGIHFFNPVPKMQLVEVVHTENVDKNMSERALGFVHQIGKLPLIVKNCPGFLVNRVIAAYLLEAAHLLDEGVSVTQLDHAALDFGMVMGPIAMMDLVGLDICVEVVKNIDGVIPKILSDKVAAGHLGKKTGEGFYTYKNGKLQAPVDTTGSNSMGRDAICDRLMCALINECVACLAEGIVASPEELDAGIIFGMGFAPFRGGPMAYAKSLGYEQIIEKLKGYEKTIGPRFKPAAGWTALIP